MAHTYLVTGGAGFIGSHLVAELVSLGHRVNVLDNLSSGRLDNLSAVLDRIEFFEGDIRDRDAADLALQGVDYVLHEAALASVTFSVDDPLTAHDVNVTGTLNMLLAARDAHVQRFVLASSCAVYGDNPNLPLREDMATNPLSPYAVSKLAGEDYCRTFFKVYGLPTVALRYFNVFGPRQDPDSEYSAVIPKFIDRAVRGSPLIIYGDGQQSRDFVYVSNVVEANLLACQVPDAAGQVVNVSAGKRYSLLDLVHALEPLVGDGSLTVEHQPARTGDILHSEGDINKAKQVLKYEPRVDFETGLRKTVMFVKG